jgi:O-antigen/teichoic acid export membrane protein
MLEADMKTRDFFYSHGVTYVGTAASVVLMAAFYVISLRIGPEAYGALQSTFSFMFLLFAGRAAAAGYVVLNAAGDERALGSVTRTALRLGFLMGLLIAGAFFALSPFLRDFLRLQSTAAFVLIGVAAIPGMIGGMNDGILNVQRRFGALAVSSAIAPASNVLLAALLLRDGFQEMDAGLIVLGGQCFGCLNALFVRWDFLGSDKRVAPSRSALREVSELVAASLLFGASLRLDVYWAKHVLSPEQAGVYAIAASIAVVLYMMSNGVARVTSVSLRGDTAMKSILASYGLIIAVSATLAGGFWAFGPPTLRLLVGHDVAIDWSVLAPLFAALTFHSIVTFDFTCMNVATKRVHVGIGVLLVAVQTGALVWFGSDARSIALSQCAAMGALTIVFSASLKTAVKALRASPAAHPAEAHLQQA